MWPDDDVATALLEGQLAAVAAAAAERGALAGAIGDAAARLRSAGGRLCYAGAGTSGRLAVLDGVELTPTFNWPRERLAFFLAGGAEAMMAAIEGAEDDTVAARDAVVQAGLGADDVLIAVAASGHTPYTVAARDTAARAGALTIVIAGDADAPLARGADHALIAETGAELIAGSTRMKAGTAQKALLNAVSTGIMIRLGRVHDGYMVEVQATNAKLRRRARAMVATLAQCAPDQADACLQACGGRVKPAVLMARFGLDADRAAVALDAAGGHLRTAMTAMTVRDDDT